MYSRGSVLSLFAKRWVGTIHNDFTNEEQEKKGISNFLEYCW